MKFLTDLYDSLIDTFYEMGISVGSSIPKLLVFLIILLIGHFLGKIIQKVMTKALIALNLDEAIKKINLDVMLHKMKPGLSIVTVICKLLYWMVMLVFITAAANYMGMTMVTDAITAFFAYLPTLLTSVIILIIGLYIADVAKSVVYTAANSIGISGAKAISSIVYYLLAIMIVVTSLKQAGIDTTMITTNLSMILGAVLLAFAISYGFSSRELVKNILSSYYGRGKFKEGMIVKIGEVEGTIQKIDSISVTIQASDRIIVLPSKTLVEDKVEIIQS